MKKNDYKLIVSVVAAAVVLFVIFSKVWNHKAVMVEVTIDGKMSGRYSLAVNQEIEINNTNLLVIQDGKADMADASCPDQLCVKQKPISKDGESLICLPNKVIVTAISNENRENELDTVVN